MGQAARTRDAQGVSHGVHDSKSAHGHEWKQANGESNSRMGQIQRFGETFAGTHEAQAGPRPLPYYSMPTIVARSGTVNSASAVVMNVPCAIVFASPWYW